MEPRALESGHTEVTRQRRHALSPVGRMSLRPTAVRERVLASTGLAELDHWIRRATVISGAWELLAHAGLAEGAPPPDVGAHGGHTPRTAYRPSGQCHPAEPV
ncbi:hypothetical protein SCE1572_37690 [Sorangium cellulosum So0157-2]|uniref:Uncharacterized protein n=1 Tax=Sorangium cellulosum So0157-2 TaxID=1254432 RepID=S4Y677_SORCE|nr:hypothetical protein SCE1572_37690 [Sorangium cellulosum So0157-2]